MSEEKFRVLSSATVSLENHRDPMKDPQSPLLAKYPFELGFQRCFAVLRGAVFCIENSFDFFACECRR